MISSSVAVSGSMAPGGGKASFVGQVDDFEGGTTQGWFINAVGMGAPPAAVLPTNIATGGPGGFADNYLRLNSIGGGGSGSRLAVSNADPRWAGNYLVAGVSAITMDVINLGSTDLALRLAIEDPTVGPPSNVAFSTDAVIVPVGRGWTPVTFLIGPGNLTAGLGDVNAALTGATFIRLYHSPAPGFPNPVVPIPAVVAQLGVDNITATAVPEPSTLTLAGFGVLGLLGYVRWTGGMPSRRVGMSCFGLGRGVREHAHAARGHAICELLVRAAPAARGHGMDEA